VFALLVNPSNPNTDPQSKDAQEAARTKAVQVTIVKASTEDEIDDAFATLVNFHADALIVASDPFFSATASDLSRWRHNSQCPRFTLFAVTPRRAD
jgi:hypothetical protein